MREFIECLLPPALFGFVCIGGLMFAVNGWKEYTCGKYAEITGRETKWVFMNECYINAGGDWLKEDEYAAVLVAREGLLAR